jgi:hypothetical protein
MYASGGRQVPWFLSVFIVLSILLCFVLLFGFWFVLGENLDIFFLTRKCIKMSNAGKNGNVAKKVTKASKYDWDKIEKLILGGATNREILAMPEFSGMPYAYLKNQSARLKLHRKREEVAQLAQGQLDRSLADIRTLGIEEHHLFTFEQLEKMRRAIKEHKVTGKVQDLRGMMTLFQQYIDAAEKSYGLQGKSVDDRAISLNAMVALHIQPPQKDNVERIAVDVAVVDAEVVPATNRAEGSAGDEGTIGGAESGGSDPDSAAEG